MRTDNNREKATYSVERTTVLLGLSKSSVYEGIRNGQIPHIRIGRRILIPRIALDRMLSGQQKQV